MSSPYAKFEANKTELREAEHIKALEAADETRKIQQRTMNLAAMQAPPEEILDVKRATLAEKTLSAPSFKQAKGGKAKPWDGKLRNKTHSALVVEPAVPEAEAETPPSPEAQPVRQGHLARSRNVVVNALHEQRERQDPQ